MFKIDEGTCIDCGFCEKICPKNAITATKLAYKVTDSCVSCSLCAKNCPVKAISKQG